MRSFARVASSSLLAALLASTASAQSVDYQSLQDTIGEPVTTSVTGKPQRASETPASIEIITRDQIAHSPAHDVPGLLQTYAGVDVNRWTAGQTDVAVRGGVQTYNPRLLVLVDGRQVYLDHYGMTDWNLLGVQLEEIQQIELVRGPATALFGFNAASGVVNIITIKAAAAKPSLITSVEGGTHGYRRLSAVATVPIGENAGLRVSGGHQREHERGFADDQAPLSTGKPVKRDEVDATLEVSPDARTHVTVDGGFSSNGQVELLPTAVATRQHFEVSTAGLRADHDTDWGVLTGRVYANWLEANYGAGASGSTALDAGNFKNRIVAAQGATLVRLGLNDTLRLSVEYRNNRIDGLSLFAPQIDYSVWSGGGMIDLHPNDRVALTFAGRVDQVGLGADGDIPLPAANVRQDFDRKFVRPSFNAAALFKVGDGGQLRINGGLGYQIPSLVDFGLRLELGPFPNSPQVFLAGTPELNPVPVWSGEIGYSRPLSDNAKLDASLFYTVTRGAIATPGESLPLTPIMNGGLALVTRFGPDGDFRTMGAEVSAEGKIGKHITWRANYTFTDTNEKLQPVDVQSLSPRDTTARHKANVELGYQDGSWFATSALRYRSATRQFSDNMAGQIVLFDVPSAFAWDQKIGMAVGRATFTLTGENLTAARGASGSPIPADRRILLGVKLGL